MNKILMIGVIVVAAIAGVIWWSMTSENSNENLNNTSTPILNRESNVQNTNSEKETEVTNDRYVEYSPENFANSASNRRVLFFYADWCPICRPADADFQTNENQIPSDVTVIRVNYNDTKTDQDEKDLATEYGVTYQHTFVQIDSAGKAVTTWNGGQLDELVSNIK